MIGGFPFSSIALSSCDAVAIRSTPASLGRKGYLPPPFLTRFFLAGITFIAIKVVWHEASVMSQTNTFTID